MLPARSVTSAVLVAGVLLAGCGGEDRSAGSSPASGGDAAESSLPRGAEPVDVDPRTFSPDIDNRHWPMRPGRRWTYREVDEQGKELRVIVTATSQTRRLANGVTARVVRDTVTEDGALIEDTLDWYAQDRRGNVWYMGEDTAEFEDGRLTTRSGSFEAGVDGALPGIAMPARPVDDLRYRQEYYAGEAEDNGEIQAVGEQVDVPAGHYTDVVQTKDTNALDPKVSEIKFYAPGVGPVLALGISGGGAREELVKVEQVSAKAATAAATTPLGRPYP